MSQLIALHAIDEQPAKVVFDMWGQRCETVCSSEAEAMKWLSICASKGWLLAIEVIGVDGVVLHAGRDLQEAVDR